MTNGPTRRSFNQSIIYGGAALILDPAKSLGATGRKVFTKAEWITVESMTSRIIPTDGDPGAKEANCVNFIDNALANTDKDKQTAYRVGVQCVDALTVRRFGKAFAQLSPAKQDLFLKALESGTVDGWVTKGVRPADFFEMVRVHTIIGFLAEPRYGGNRDHVGWKVVGYPGPRYGSWGYSPQQMLGKQKIKTTWGDDLSFSGKVGNLAGRKP